jgi:hypothetical protein
LREVAGARSAATRIKAPAVSECLLARRRLGAGGRLRSRGLSRRR